ncbi:MAG: hypothetical protein V1743_06935 [Nanoarchaeota archaeon]
MEQPNPHELKKTSLAPCEHGREFWINHGAIVNNLRQLADEIDRMSWDTFKHHVGQEKDDFAAWIKDVLDNPFLANDLHSDQNINDKSQYARTLRDHMGWLEAS